MQPLSMKFIEGELLLTWDLTTKISEFLISVFVKKAKNEEYFQYL